MKKGRRFGVPFLPPGEMEQNATQYLCQKSHRKALIEEKYRFFGDKSEKNGLLVNVPKSWGQKSRNLHEKFVKNGENPIDIWAGMGYYM